MNFGRLRRERSGPLKKKKSINQNYRTTRTANGLPWTHTTRFSHRGKRVIARTALPTKLLFVPLTQELSKPFVIPDKFGSKGSNENAA